MAGVRCGQHIVRMSGQHMVNNTLFTYDSEQCMCQHMYLHECGQQHIVPCRWSAMCVNICTYMSVVSI